MADKQQLVRHVRLNHRMYFFLLALIYIAFISLGLPDSLLGSAWPAIRGELNVPVSFLGVVSMIISGGTVLSSLLSDKLISRLGTRAVTVISVFLTAAALIGFFFADSFPVLAVFAVPYGLGAGAVDAALNNYVALRYPSGHMSWLHCLWGAGAIAGPFIMGHAISTSTWHFGYLAVGLVQTAIGLLLLVTLPVWKANGADGEKRRKSIGLKAALKIKGVPQILIGFFAYSAAEATAMNWASTYFVEAKGLTAEQAAQFAALFYIGITAGRFLSGFVTGRLGDRRTIVIGTCVLSCGIIAMAVPVGVPALSAAGFVVAGLGCAPVYPCIIHATPGNFGAENSGAIIGMQMAGAYTGSTFIPPLFGLLGSAAGFAVLPCFLLAFAVLMITMTELSFRAAKNGQLRM